ncbi:MAG: hypothetical protein ACOYXC_13095 [Candidatus Rifleibacteriota bacterium]
MNSLLRGNFLSCLKPGFFVLFIFIFLGSASSVDAVSEKQPEKNRLSQNHSVAEAKDKIEKKARPSWKISGRLRTNSFFCERTGAKEDYGTNFNRYAPDKTELYNPRGFVSILSLDLQSPVVNNFSLFASHYLGTDFGTLEPFDYRMGKSGKDTFVPNTSTGEPGNFNVTAQLFLKYQFENFEAKVGRFIFDTILTHSNDTKAVPNTFTGLAIKQNFENKGVLTFAFLTLQKLRNRNSFHDLLTFGTAEDDNDDSGMHKGLTRARLDASGKPEQRLLVLGWEKIEKRRHSRNFLYVVPQMFSTAVIEGKWQLNRARGKESPKITGWARLIEQKDQGAGAVGGGKLDGSAAPCGGSLDGRIWMIKLQANWNAHEAWLGYSQVADRGDIVAPWRGFPTHGFTRNMTEVNWTAGTRSRMLAWNINFEKMGLLKGARLLTDISIHDRPETAGKISSDARAWHCDLIYRIPRTEIEMKIRYLAHFGKAEQDFRDSRLEFNYLF